MRDFIADLVGPRPGRTLRDLLVEEMARRATLAAEAPPEPVAPGSMDRELREPVTIRRSGAKMPASRRRDS